MSPADGLPIARDGLLIADHVKCGRRFITVLDRARERVVLLEPWEHAVLVLADGSRTPKRIAEVVTGGVRSVSESQIRACLEHLEREGLLRSSEDELLSTSERTTLPPGPRTLARLQQAYREWHKDPVRTGQILLGELPVPYPLSPKKVPVDLGPTVAFNDADTSPLYVGSTIEVGQGQATHSLLAVDSTTPDLEATQIESISEAEGDETLDAPLDVAELLRAVDADLSSFADEEATQVPVAPGVVGPRAKGGEAVVPTGRHDLPMAGQVVTPEDHSVSAVGGGDFAPTVVGRPAEDPRAPLELLAPLRADEENQDRRESRFQEETLLVQGRAEGSHELELPAQRGFSRLWHAVRSVPESGFEAGMGSLPAVELAALLMQLRELRALHPDSAPVQTLLMAVEFSARGETRNDGSGALRSAVRWLMNHGRCPRCTRGAGQPLERCPNCGFSEVP